DGVAHGRADAIDHRLVGYEALTQVALQQVAHPAHVLNVYRLVEPELRTHALDRLGSHARLQSLTRQEVARDQLTDEESQHGGADERRDHLKYAPYYEQQHSNASAPACNSPRRRFQADADARKAQIDSSQHKRWGGG